MCTNAASRARDGDPFCACGDCFRAGDGRVLFHGPRVDGFDLIGPESGSYEDAGDRGSLPH